MRNGTNAMVAIVRPILLFAAVFPWMDRVSTVSGDGAGEVDFVVSPWGRDTRSGQLVRYLQ
jgi:hypothetical protein